MPNYLQHPSLQPIRDPHSGLSVRLALAPAEFARADALVASRYAWRGYNTENLLPPHGLALTLIAELNSQTVGTLTLRLDSAAGLLVDSAYGNEINHLRSTGRSVCEVTRLATAPKSDAGTVLGLLFHFTYVACHWLHKATDLFIEVNPRHERFYRQWLEFVVAASRKVCPRVQAPAVLLRLDLVSFDPERLLRPPLHPALELAA